MKTSSTLQNCIYDEIIYNTTVAYSFNYANRNDIIHLLIAISIIHCCNSNILFFCSFYARHSFFLHFYHQNVRNVTHCSQYRKNIIIISLAVKNHICQLVNASCFQLTVEQRIFVYYSIFTERVNELIFSFFLLFMPSFFPSNLF